jgi:DNA-directed RNA polymerase subunit K/omega
MIKPPIEELLKETPGRFALVITASTESKRHKFIF